MECQQSQNLLSKEAKKMGRSLLERVARKGLGKVTQPQVTQLPTVKACCLPTAVLSELLLCMTH